MMDPCDNKVSHKRAPANPLLCIKATNHMTLCIRTVLNLASCSKDIHRECYWHVCVDVPEISLTWTMSVTLMGLYELEAMASHARWLLLSVSDLAKNVSGSVCDPTPNFTRLRPSRI